MVVLAAAGADRESAERELPEVAATGMRPEEPASSGAPGLDTSISLNQVHLCPRWYAS
jgi:hypothetical protein